MLGLASAAESEPDGLESSSKRFTVPIAKTALDRAQETREALDAQIDATVANEARLLEEFRKVITVKDVQVADAGKVIAEYDQIWLPKAPVLADLRALGATL